METGDRVICYLFFSMSWLLSLGETNLASRLYLFFPKE
nr:MAG TPA: hypothetical protein [Caudoviricetes sp.]